MMLWGWIIVDKAVGAPVKSPFIQLGVNIKPGLTHVRIGIHAAQGIPLPPARKDQPFGMHTFVPEGILGGQFVAFAQHRSPICIERA